MTLTDKITDLAHALQCEALKRAANFPRGYGLALDEATAAEVWQLRLELARRYDAMVDLYGLEADQLLVETVQAERDRLADMMAAKKNGPRGRKPAKGTKGARSQPTLFEGART